MGRNREIPDISDEDAAFIRSWLIHEDAAVLAFDKPSGLPSQTRGNRGRNLDHLLWAFAKSNGKRPRLVHRLDAGTSGVILAARTKPAAVALSEVFAGRDAQKTYLALVDGTAPDPGHGVCDQRIVRKDRRVQLSDRPDIGDEALTEWQQIGTSSGGHALVLTRPYTGRMHQIRAHLAGLGCPISGDEIYGSGQRGDRLMLHALRLRIPHPDGGELDLEAPLPDEFVKRLDEAGLQPPAPGSV